MAKIIGIDLGTSNSAAAVMMGGKPAMIPSAEGVTMAGGKAFPSFVAFAQDTRADRSALRDGDGQQCPERSAPKAHATGEASVSGTLMVGEPARRQAVSNPEGTVFAAKRKMGSDYKYRIHGKEYSPQQISGFLLQKIKRDAEAFIGEPVTKAVITVPAYFNDNQRQATKDAGQIAGLEVVRIINEPTAASLAYGLDKGAKEQRIMVFDIGGGTLDVTIMEFGGGVFEVKSTSGDTQLGGTDMDNILQAFLIEEFRKQSSVDVSKDKMAVQRIREAGEKAKIELSTVLSSEINLPFLAMDSSGPKNFTYNFTRAKLEELVRPTVDRCKRPMERAMADAKLSTSQIEKVILVGGPTRMPIVRKFVESFMGKPAEHGVDPMECVALGAAIQGGVLAGDVKDILLLDVTPLSLGLETLGAVFTRLIDRNTTIPTRKSQIFSTAADFQTAVTIHVLQGERAMAGDNISLGQFNLVGLPPAPRGIPQIEVTFDIDADGILHVSAKDKGTGKEQKMQISAPLKMSDEEKKRAVEDAERFAEQDKKKKEEAEVRNNADTIAYTAEKTLSDLGDKVKEDQKKNVQDAVKALKEALANKDTDNIKKLTDELMKVLQEVGASVYQQAGAGATGGAQPGAEAGYDEPQQGAQKKEWRGKPTDGTESQEDAGGEGKKTYYDADYEVDKDKK